METDNRRVKANIFLLITAAIWGFGFVAQRFGAMLIAPFTFNALRFGIGALSLIPLLMYKKKTDKFEGKGGRKDLLVGGILAGSAIFLAAWLQQAGMEYTDPGKASFLTACYMVLVPVLGIIVRNKTTPANWAAVLLAVIGLYFLCLKGGFEIEKGDILELSGAFFWAAQILIVDKFVDRVDSVALSFVQFAACSVLCFAVALPLESVSSDSIGAAIIPVLYGGLCSVGIAYTLQAVAQRDAVPSHAALILSSEIVFGTLGGIIFFRENLGIRGYIGCAFIIAGVLISVVRSGSKNKIRKSQ